MPLLPAETPLARALRRRLRASPDLLPPGTRVLVALSGGLDSIVLLHLLRFGEVVSLEVRAAHFDHAMRPDSHEDRAWARERARAWGVPLESARSHVPLRSEAEARAARYAFLHDAADRAGASRIALGHHADDQIETVLLRMLRGTGIAGLGGMRERRGIVVRPLLAYRRKRLLRYARAAGLEWREDPSNLDTRFARNLLRQRLLPALEAAAPGSRRAVLHMARVAAHAERVLHPLIEEARSTAVTREGVDFVLARDVLLAYDPWTRARVIHGTLQRAGSRIDRSTIRRVGSFLDASRSGATLELGGGFRLRREFERFVLYRPIVRPPDRPLRVAAEAGQGSVVLGGTTVCVAWGPRPAVGTTIALRADTLRFPLTVRGWQPGDRIRLSYGTKKLKKLFAERRLARSDRNRVPVLADSEGRILGVAGMAVACPAEARAGHPTLYLTVLE